MFLTLLMLIFFTLIMDFTSSRFIVIHQSKEENDKQIDTELGPVTRCTFLTFGQDEFDQYDYYKLLPNFNFSYSKINYSALFTHHCPPKFQEQIEHKYRSLKPTNFPTRGDSCCYGITRKPYCCSSPFFNRALWIGFVLLIPGLILVAVVAYFVFRFWK